MELRNDDIVLSGDDSSSSVSPSTEVIDDESTPYVNPYDIDTDTEAGEAGAPIDDTEPVIPTEDIPDAVSKTVTVTDTIQIENYDPVYLNSLYQDGYTFYALYDDDTIVEVPWTDVVPIDPDEAGVINLSGLAIAEAINQFFWPDDNGAHITTGTQEEWKEAEANGFNDLSYDKNYYNALFNSLGLLFRRALFNLVSISKDGIAFYDGVANEPENIMTYLSRYVLQIGRSNAKHVVIDNDGITAYNGDGTIAPLHASNITAAEANIEHLRAEKADIDAANILTERVRNSWIDKLMVQSGLLANEGTIYTLDAIQVNAANITAGTIDVDRLIVTVDGEKYLVHIDPSTSYPSYQKLDGGVIEDLTITADKIVAGAITAEKITAQNLVGTSGWINLRNGTFAYANPDTGEGISWDGYHLRIGGAAGEDLSNLASEIRYDHTYTYDSTTQTYTFTASVTKAGVDVTNDYASDFFVWYLKTESDTTLLGHGKTLVVQASDALYTGTVLGGLEESLDYDVITSNGDTIQTNSGDDIYASVIWEV